MSFRAIATFAAGLVLYQQIPAVDGIAVTTACRFDWNYTGKAPEQELNNRDDTHYNPGRIIRIGINNNLAVSCDTIHDETLGRFPVFNIDGTRIAFQRWSARVENGQLVDQNLPNYISVMDTDGTNVVDLAEQTDRKTKLDWAREGGEDWVYYTKPGPEVWRVKWNDPSTNALAYSYQAPEVDGFWRWDIAADGSRAMINYHFTNGGYTNVPHTLPFSTVPLPGSQGGTADDIISCNGTISPSGKYVATFMVGGHGASTIARWDPGWLWGNDYTVVYLSEMTDSLGEYIGANMEMHRWAANSDKWMCLAPTGGYQGFYEAGNQALSNWVDREFIKTTHNEYQKSTDPGVEVIYACLSGDFWVEGGPAGCYEDSSGNWISVENGQVVSARTPGPRGWSFPAANGPSSDVAEVYSLKGARMDTHRGPGMNPSYPSAAYVVVNRLGRSARVVAGHRKN